MDTFKNTFNKTRTQKDKSKKKLVPKQIKRNKNKGNYWE